MKIAFVYPWFEKFLTNNPELNSGLVDYFLGDFTTPPSLGIPILAGMTPDWVDYEFLDDNSGDPIDYTKQYDLVAINCFTPQATRAFEIADQFRAQGTKVIMGGFFPSFESEACFEHCDSVNIGEGEPTWLTILEDAKNGTLQRIYNGGNKLPADQFPMPDREIFYCKENYTWKEDLIQISRGCPYKCAMCAIPEHMGHKIRLRPVDQVVAELKTLKYENVYLADDSLFFPGSKFETYARELLTAVIPLKKKFFVSSSVKLNCDDALLDLMVEAGVKNFYCTMNVDPISIAALRGDEEAQNHIIDLVERLESRGIRFFGSCAIGRDWDDNTIADRVLDLYTKANIKTSEFFLWTPYPGSEQYLRMKKQGRIFDTVWQHYNGAHVVFHPELMSADELYGQFIKLWNNYYDMIKNESAANLEPSTWENGKEVVGIPLQKKGVRGETVITGIGVLSPIGRTKESILESLKTGRDGLGPITRFDGSLFTLKDVGEVKTFDPLQELTETERLTLSDRYLQMSLVAAREALADAGIAITDTANPDIALVLATCNGGLNSGEEEYRWKHGKSDKPFTEQTNLQAQFYGFGKALAGSLNISGESWIITTACSSTTAAIGLAKTLISRGYYKKVLVGGADALAFSNVAGFDALKGTSDQKTAPFSLPIGLNIGEAAAFWVVQEMESTILEGTAMYGRVAGSATTSDAYHPTTPDPRGDGAYRTIAKALENAGMKIGQMGVINAHGTGTNANDKAEIKGIERLLDNGESVPVVSTKSFFGHCMGSTGILEATANLLAMNEGFIPPTIHFTEPRIETALDFVPNEPRFTSYDSFVSSNYAFGGNNAAAVITQWDRPIEPKEKINQRVVITGAGVVSTIGLGMEQHLNALSCGDRGVRDASHLKIKGTRSDRAAIVPEFTAREVNRRLDFKGKNRISMMATSASFWAFEQAGISPNRKNCDDLGLAMGVCNGPSQMEYMDGVWEGDTPNVDVGCFSNLTTNSVAGWVSNLLMLKGENITLCPGPHGGMQAIAYAFDAIAQGTAVAMVAGGADEIDPQTLYNYDLIGYTLPDEVLDSFAIRDQFRKEKLLGEGSAVLLVEPESQAKERGAAILGEILGYGLSCDAVGFLDDGLNPEQLARAVKTALSRAECSADQIDLVVWAPQGNIQDRKILSALELALGKETFDAVQLVADSTHTGFSESTSSVSALAAVLASCAEKRAIWPQRYNDESLDNRIAPEQVKLVLTVGSSDVGANFALIVRVE